MRAVSSEFYDGWKKLVVRARSEKAAWACIRIAVAKKKKGKPAAPARAAKSFPQIRRVTSDPEGTIGAWRNR